MKVVQYPNFYLYSASTGMEPTKGKKLDARPVTDLKEHKININMVNLNRRESSHIPANYDLRPLHLRFADARAFDILRADLLNINHRSAFNCILVPCSERALHDHTYSKQLERDASESVPEASHQPPIPAICPFNAEEMKERCKTIKQQLQVSSEVRQKIEQATPHKHSATFGMKTEESDWL